MIKTFKDKKPQIDESVFIAEGSQLIGDIKIKENCSIWYNVVVRADVNSVTIEENTNVQDGAVIHVSEGYPTSIGKGVTIGHNAIVHGATVGDYTLIGMGSTVLDGAQIGKHCIVGAGALVTGHTIIEEGMLVLGSPAKAIKPLSKEQIEGLYASAENYVALSSAHKQE